MTDPDQENEETELELVYNDLHRAQEKIKHLQLLCTRAADALEADNPHWSGQRVPLIEELRKAGK